MRSFWGSILRPQAKVEEEEASRGREGRPLKSICSFHFNLLFDVSVIFQFGSVRIFSVLFSFICLAGRVKSYTHTQTHTHRWTVYDQKLTSYFHFAARFNDIFRSSFTFFFRSEAFLQHEWVFFWGNSVSTNQAYGSLYIYIVSVGVCVYIVSPVRDAATYNVCEY